MNVGLMCDRFGLPPVPARSALGILSRSGYIEYVDEVASRSRVFMTVRRDELYAMRLDPGDEVIIPEPAYANYMAFAISAARALSPFLQK